VLPALAERWRDRLTLQLVAMVPITHWGTAAGEALAQAVAARGGLLGGVLGPPFHRGPEDRRGLESLLRLADRHGCSIDLHVDEGEDQPGEGVALICSLLEQLNLRLPITCSHAASMALLPRPALERLLERMARRNLSVVALPRTNQYLLGRQEGCTPLQRPLAPIRQLQAVGVTVAVAGDNVQDPWFPGGDFDPLALLRDALPLDASATWEIPSVVRSTAVDYESAGVYPGDLVKVETYNPDTTVFADVTGKVVSQYGSVVAARLDGLFA
jgi:cytosine deaminase